MITSEVILKSLSEVGSTTLLILAGTFVVEALLYLVLVKWLKYKYALPFMLLAPAAIGLIALVVYPLLWELRLSFTNMSLRAFKNPEFIGFKNYVRVFTEPVLKQKMFFPLLGQTILWTVVNITFHVGGGLFLAMLLNRKLKFKGVYRTLLILPWAIPAFISVLMWQGLLNQSNGAVNVVLGKFGISPVPWLVDPTWACISVLMVNIWLGYPFMMTICLSSLQSISKSVYEAADIDGASAWTQFTQITLPLLKASLIPVLISNFAFNFNQFTAIYLLTKGGPAVQGSDAGATDILITYSYKLAFDLFQYGLACAYAIFIFVLVATLSGVNFKLTGAFDEAS